MTLAWSPSPTAGVVGYRLYYGGSSGVYTNQISTANTTGAIISGLVPGATYFFAAAAYEPGGLESPLSNEVTYAVPLNAPSLLPSLNPVSNFHLAVNTAAQTVTLTGISPGAASSAAGHKSVLKITAVSGNRKLLPKPVVRYTAGSTATLTFKPARNVTGTTTITITVNNGAKNNNLVKQTFTVAIFPASQATPATLSPAAPVNGQFALNVAGASGRNYIVQASANLVDWVPVQTNTSPFTFTDPHTGEFSQRFYRSVSGP